MPVFVALPFSGCVSVASAHAALVEAAVLSAGNRLSLAAVYFAQVRRLLGKMVSTILMRSRLLLITAILLAGVRAAVQAVPSL